MAPNTRNQIREPDVRDASTETETLQSIEVMSATQLTDAQQLATAREQVRQLQEQLNQAATASQRSASQRSSLEPSDRTSTVKLKDPDPLTDGVLPSFDNWRIQIEDKFLINTRMFDSEQVKMAYIFNQTADVA
jgi:hypothetical protein